MNDLLCAMCIANRPTGKVRPAATILAGIAVCIDPDDEDGTGAHYDAAWQILTGTEHEIIANADGHTFTTPDGIVR